MPKCDWWEQQTLMLRSRCNWLGRNGISGHLRRFCLLVFFSFKGNVLYIWYTPRKHVWCNSDEWVYNLEISIPFMLAFYLLLTTEVECLRICKHGNCEWVASNRTLSLRTGFWDGHGAIIKLAIKERMVKGCLDVQKKRFWRGIMAFSQ